MKQLIFDQGTFSGGATASSYITGKAIWPGGNGWLVVGTFTQVSGTPSMLAYATVDGATTSQDLVTSPITAAGIYPFFAPKDAIITCQINANVGEQVSFQGVFVQGVSRLSL